MSEHKYKDVRSDGYIFLRTFKSPNGKTYEQWTSPKGWLNNHAMSLPEGYLEKLQKAQNN